MEADGPAAPRAQAHREGAPILPPHMEARARTRVTAAQAQRIELVLDSVMRDSRIGDYNPAERQQIRAALREELVVRGESPDQIQQNRALVTGSVRWVQANVDSILSQP
jgi:hypothetical protein